MNRCLATPQFEGHRRAWALNYATTQRFEQSLYSGPFNVSINWLGPDQFQRLAPLVVHAKNDSTEQLRCNHNDLDVFERFDMLGMSFQGNIRRRVAELGKALGHRRLLPKTFGASKQLPIQSDAFEPIMQSE